MSDADVVRKYIDEATGFEIRIKHVIDEDPAYDYLGRFWGTKTNERNAYGPPFPFYDRLFKRVFIDGDEREKFFMEKEQQNRELFDELYADEAWDNREYRYIVPDANDYGDVTDVEERRKYLTHDAERLLGLGEDWNYLGIVAEAWMNGVEFYASSIWGVEDDSGDEYIKEVEDEVAGMAIDEAQNRLDEIRSDEREVKIAREVAPMILRSLVGLMTMVGNVLTDSQLDHEQCGTTIRRAIEPAQAVIKAAEEAGVKP